MTIAPVSPAYMAGMTAYRHGLLCEHPAEMSPADKIQWRMGWSAARYAARAPDGAPSAKRRTARRVRTSTRRPEKITHGLT